VEANKAKLQAFICGWYRSMDYAMKNPDEANPIMAKGLGMPDAEFADALSGLRFIDRPEAEKLLGLGKPTGEFSKIAVYNADLWRRAGVANARLANPRSTYSPVALERPSNACIRKAA
jgi:ABC-type nitrate/sulfonate/bicarbonate transport system substrate-binding protein